MAQLNGPDWPDRPGRWQRLCYTLRRLKTPQPTLTAKAERNADGGPMQSTQIVPPNTKQASHRQVTILREIVETLVLTALVFLAVHSSVVYTPIRGPSMQPGLQPDQGVIVNQLAYFFGAPQRGDVIVFHPPVNPSEEYIKRIIAIPGDTISLTDTAVKVNDVQLKEPYVNPADTGPNENGQVIPPTKLNPGEYWVMGDNRGNSIDSRAFGMVPRQNIVGKAEMVIWPPTAIHRISTYSEVFVGVGK
jgi:signal peptidase I